MADPMLTAIGGLLMLAAIIVPILYLTYLSVRSDQHRPPALGG